MLLFTGFHYYNFTKHRRYPCWENRLFWIWLSAEGLVVISFHLVNLPATIAPRLPSTATKAHCRTENRNVSPSSEKKWLTSLMKGCRSIIVLRVKSDVKMFSFRAQTRHSGRHRDSRFPPPERHGMESTWPQRPRNDSSRRSPMEPNIYCFRGTRRTKAAARRTPADSRSSQITGGRKGETCQRPPTAWSIYTSTSADATFIS